MPETDVNPSTSPLLEEIVERLRTANNVLITVSKDPSVDQLAACIGLTIALNKKDKHATAVFSGRVPSTIDFLEPEKTLEKNTDSLRDFIIALDKSKADKLRYKVEDEVVKIFITPYKTSITEKDLDFSQGDFNIDAIVALGVHDRNDLDAAIVAHGRILHDATIISVNINEGGELGSLHWMDAKASSLSEMAADLVIGLDPEALDTQIATAFLTGIVAQTDRFRNEKASPHTMSIAGSLMSAGASTQLVSSKLEEPEQPIRHDDEDNNADSSGDSVDESQATVSDDGTIQINHDDDIHIDDHGNFAQTSDILKQIDEESANEQNSEIPPPSEVTNNDQPSEAPAQTTDASLPEPEPAPQGPFTGPSMVFEPPTFGGQLTANTDKVDQRYDHAPDPLSAQPTPPSPTLNHGADLAQITPTTEAPDDQVQPNPIPESQTLSDLERSLNSPHVAQYEETPVEPPVTSQPDVPPADSDYAREAVQRAVQGSVDYKPEPIAGLNAQPLGELNHDQNGTNDEQSNGTPPPPVPPPLPPM